MHATALPISLILDTNVVLDWLVFEDKHVATFRTAVVDQRITLHTHALLLDELQRVLGYPKLNVDPSKQQEVRQTYEAHTIVASMPLGFSREQLAVPGGFPRCRDSDDDVFIALAFHTGATLVSKDRAVLKLKSRAKKFGVTIISIPDLNSVLASS